MADGDALLLERAALSPATPHKLTIDEFLLVSEHSDVNLDLIDGELFEMPQEGLEHAQHVKRLLLLLDRLAAGVGLEALANVAVGARHHTALGPDVTVFDPAAVGGNYLPGQATRLVVEAAHSTLVRDLSFKRDAYAAFGCPAYWVVDPRAQVLHVFGDLQDDRYAQSDRLQPGDALPCPFAPEQSVRVAAVLG